MKKFKILLLTICVIFIICTYLQINQLNELSEEREQLESDLNIINTRLANLNEELESTHVQDLSEYPNIEWVYQNKEFLNENLGN